MSGKPFSWVQQRLDSDRNFSAGWNSALWEVVKELIDRPEPLARELIEFCRDLAHTPPDDR
jgi:hypothetical protein